MSNKREELNEPTFRAIVNQIYCSTKRRGDRISILLSNIIDLVDDLDDHELRDGTIKLILIGLRTKCYAESEFISGSINGTRNDLNKLLEDKGSDKFIDEE